MMFILTLIAYAVFFLALFVFYNYLGHTDFGERVDLWTTPKKNCKHCCLFCEEFGSCLCDFEIEKSSSFDNEDDWEDYK